VTSLSFVTPAQLLLPVEIYDDELRLVERTLSSRKAVVDAGMYFVLAHLPDGSQLRGSVAVGGEPTAIVSLTRPEPSAQPEEPTHGLPGYRAESRMVPVIGYAREEDGTWTAVSDHFAPADGADVGVPKGVDAIAIQRLDGRMSIVRIPGRQTHYFRFALVARHADDEVDLVARIAHEDGNALLSYLNRDMLGDVHTMLDAPALRAEQYLRDKIRDPLAAAAGAYALLRMNEIERLHDWTKNLANWFDWLPDGLVVWAEHLARLGQHEQAAELLRRLPERGIPALSAGLTFACDRLRTYTRHWPDDIRLRDLDEELTRYALATDFAAPVTTYTSKGPDLPVPPAPAAADVPAMTALVACEPTAATLST